MNPNRIFFRTALVAVAALLLIAGAAAQSSEAHVYTLGSFDSIDISGSAVVRFTQGSADQVVVEGDDGTRQAIGMDVRNGTLNLHSGGSWKFWNARRLHVWVTARSLKRVNISGAADFSAPAPVKTERLSINISGAGTARFDQLQADGLIFHVSGAGDGRVAGRVEDLNIAVSGKSDLDASELKSERARVSISGVGSVGVWVTDDLAVSVAGIGTVDYWGNPKLRRSISGKGTLNDRGEKKKPGP